jgi:SAM-dependent methyltransferase
MTAGTDPTEFRNAQREQWQSAATGWRKWSPTIDAGTSVVSERLVELAGVEEGSRVLDVAAGAGEQTLTAARRVGPTGSVLAADIASNLLALAAEDARRAGLTNLDTRVMDGENLELEDSSFDAVISRVGLIYFPDQQRALREMLRVLKPGGRVAAIVYSTPENNKFFSVPVSIIRRRAQLPPPLPGQPGPFSLGAPGVLEEAYARAGFTDVQCRTVSAPLRMSSAAECVRFERESFGALHQMLASLNGADREAAWQEIEHELAAYEGASGFEGPCELIVGAGAKPL